MLKRWWWVVVAVVAVVALGAYLLIGRGGSGGPTPGGGLSAGAGTSPTGSVAATPGTQPGASSNTSAGAPTTPKPKAPKVAAKGTRLPVVTAPPNQTLAQLKFTANRNGQVYNAKFSLYGTGPVRGGHPTVVAALSSFVAAKTYSEPLKLPSDNVLLEPGPGVSLTKGGSYTGVVTLTKRGDALVLVVTAVKPA